MRIALIYGTTNGHTARVARLVRQALGPERITTFADVAGLQASDLLGHDLLVVGCPTWYVGGLQDDWEALVAGLGRVDLTGTRLALFGCGDQDAFPDTFLDGMGRLHALLTERGAANGLGTWPTAGYRFERSLAAWGDRFCGLAVDDVNEPELTDARVAAWCAQLVDELDLDARQPDDGRRDRAA